MIVTIVAVVAVVAAVPVFPVVLPVPVRLLANLWIDSRGTSPEAILSRFPSWGSARVVPSVVLGAAFAWFRFCAALRSSGWPPSVC